MGAAGPRPMPEPAPTAPAAPIGGPMLLARTGPGWKLIVGLVGGAPPAARNDRKPPLCGLTTVTLAETATAPVETPHWPLASNGRLLCAASAGAPNGPAAARVSSRRQGGTV